MQRIHRFLPASALHLDVEIHQLVEIRGRGHADHQHAQRIADEIPGGRILQKIRMIGEDAAAARVFHILLEFQDAGALNKTENLIQHAHVAQELLRGARRRAERRQAAAPHFAHHRRRVGHHHNSGGGASHNQQLSRLKQDVKVPVFEQISADHRGEDCGNTD